ncbi:jg24586, partial [Pararge aegeria aegeria]
VSAPPGEIAVKGIQPHSDDAV